MAGNDIEGRVCDGCEGTEQVITFVAVDGETELDICKTCRDESIELLKLLRDAGAMDLGKLN